MISFDSGVVSQGNVAITVDIGFHGDLDFIKAILKRTHGGGVVNLLRNKWADSVKERIKKMHESGGSIPGEQDSWAPNSLWTVRQKGHNTVLTGKRKRWHMKDRYHVTMKQISSTVWQSVLTNTATNNGFPYPVAVHSGIGKTAIPLSQGKNAFRIPMADGSVVYFRKRVINRNPIPPRPHLNFTDGDADKAITMITDHIMGLK